MFLKAIKNYQIKEEPDDEEVERLDSSWSIDRHLLAEPNLFEIFEYVPSEAGFQKVFERLGKFKGENWPPVKSGLRSPTG